MDLYVCSHICQKKKCDGNIGYTSMEERCLFYYLFMLYTYLYLR